ncbi:hypothetical protein C8Q78DRAFT_1040246 [Trametes maxima]|nr:hypothetical protein C8Q78DRAFT_1040246 [Trametes maxima]
MWSTQCQAQTLKHMIQLAALACPASRSILLHSRRRMHTSNLRQRELSPFALNEASATPGTNRKALLYLWPWVWIRMPPVLH